MAVIGTPRTFEKKFKFIIEIDGFPSSGWNKCSELSAELGTVSYREGGSLIPDKSPGLMTFTDVTLERGATTDRSAFAWFKEVANAANNGGSGLTDPAFKRNLDIVQLDRDGTEIRRYRLQGAWPSKFVAGEWDNEAEENVIEMITLVFDFFDEA